MIHMLKKLATTMTLTVFGIFLISASVPAQEAIFSLDLDGAYGDQGQLELAGAKSRQTFKVQVFGQDLIDMKAFDFEIRYDSSLLSPVKGEPGLLTRGFEISEIAVSFGALNLSGSSTVSAAEGDGHIATVTFEVLSDFDSAGADKITLSSMSIVLSSGISLGILPDDVSVTVTSSPPSDPDIRVPQDFATIREAISKAISGQTIFVSAGLYEENITLKNGVDLLGEDPATTIIDGGGTIAVTTANNVTFSGFTVRNGGGFAVYAWKTSPTIKNNIITGSERAIATNARPIIANNIITGNTIMGIFIGVNSASPVTPHPVIANNLIVNNPGAFGIFLFRAGGTLINNTIDSNGSHGISIMAPADPAKHRIDIRNNLITSNTLYGISGFEFDGLQHTNDYNDVWNNGSGDYRIMAAGPNSLNKDPLYTTPLKSVAAKLAQAESEEFDYLLKPGSPVIDAGDPASIFLDADGTRNDMGALGGPDKLTASFTVEIADIQVSVTALDFGELLADSSSAQTFRITNPSEATLSVTDVVLSGENATAFSVTPVSFTVRPGGTQDVTVTFKPTSDGAKTSTLTIEHNAPGDPLEISLTGTGVEVQVVSNIALSDTTLDFGSVNVGSELALGLTLENPGLKIFSISLSDIIGLRNIVPAASSLGIADLSILSITSSDPAYSVSMLTFDISLEKSQEITVTFKPIGSGSRSAILSIEHNAPNEKSPITVALSGIGLAPDIEPSPPSLTFGTVTVGESEVRSLRISNVGNASLSISSFTNTASAFTIDAVLPFSIGASLFGEITVTFTPDASGALLDTLVISSDDPEEPDLEIQMSGSGAAGGTGISVSPSSISFGDIQIDQTRDTTLVISNTGGSDLTVTDIEVDSTFFQVISETSLTIGAGATANVTVRFAPTTSGDKTGTLTVVNNAERSERLDIPLSGRGRGGNLVLVPSDTLRFATTTTSSQGQVVLKTDGNIRWSILNVASSDQAQFSVLQLPGGLSVGETDSLQVIVTFAPSSAGTKSAVLTVIATATVDGQQLVEQKILPMSGTGLEESDLAAVESRVLLYGEVPVDSTRTDTVRLINPTSGKLSGDAEVIGANFKTLTAPLAFPFDVSAGDTTKIPVRFTPDEQGDFVARLRISINGQDDIEVILSGSGIVVDTEPRLTVQPQPLDFGSIQINETITLPITIINDGGGRLSIFNISSNNADYSLQTRSDASFDLDPGSNKRVQLIVTPTRRGTVEATMTIASNDPNNPNFPFTVLADVQGLPGPDFTVVTAPVDFGQVGFGIREAFDLVIKNEGVAPGQVFSVRADNNQVRVTSQVPVSIQPDKTTVITLSYTPQAYRSRQGEITLYTEDDSKPLIRVGWQATEVPVTAVEINRTNPRDGDVDTELTTDISVRFSEEILTIGRNYVAADITLLPKPLTANWQDNWDLSSDGKTLSFDEIELETDRVYRLTVFSAVGRSGNELVSPVDAVFSTGTADVKNVGSISGIVSLAKPVVQPDGSSLVDTTDNVEGRVIAVDASNRIVAEAPITECGKYELEGLPPDDYKFFVELEGEDAPISIGFDNDDDNIPDQVTIASQEKVETYDLVVEDVEFTEDAPGVVMFDGNPDPGNQETLEASFGTNEVVTIALYADQVEDLTRFEAILEYDSTQLQFSDFDMPTDGEDIALLATGDQDQAVSASKSPVIERQGETVTVEENQIKIEGKALDGSSSNAISGGGLFGLISFIKTGSAKAGLHQASPTISLKKITLFSVNKKQTIEDAGTITVALTSEPNPDFNGNGSVGFEDFVQFAQAFGSEPEDNKYDAKFDLNVNDSVDFADFVLFAQSYGQKVGKTAILSKTAN